MGNWSPSPQRDLRDFEDEMMDMQPDCDMIYVNNNNETNTSVHTHMFSCETSNTAKIREMALKKNKVGCQYESDGDDEYTKEFEIISMIRNCGLDSDANGYIDSRKTLPTISSRKKYETNGKDRNFVIFLDKAYFKLQPKDTDENSDSNSSAKASISKTQSESTTLLEYYEKIKFYSAKELYYKKRANKKSEKAANLSTPSTLSPTVSSTLSSTSYQSFTSTS